MENYLYVYQKLNIRFLTTQKNLLCDKPFNITIRDVEIKAGAGFLVVYTGNVITMPGLPKVPAAEKINIDNDGNIVGLF